MARVSRYPGVETVDIEVREPTARIVLNAVNTTFRRRQHRRRRAARGGHAGRRRGDRDVHLCASRSPPGRTGCASASPSQINKFGSGFFFVDYPTDNGSKRMLSSKLEPSDARRIFPCWDEPAFKATFALDVTVPRQFMAVGNMPIVARGDGRAGPEARAFAPTPKMSSYLFVLTAGELERITAEVDGVTVGVVTTAGKAPRAASRSTARPSCCAISTTISA